MAGLIPLFLTSNAASGTTRSRPASPATSLRESTNGAETPTTQSPSRTSSPQPQSQPRLRQTAMKRPSFQTPAPLPVLPYTPAEWKKTVAEVKRQHLMRRYRACSERCSEILDNLKDTSHVEPLYLIYLHFFAASSQEMCARPLHGSSPSRAKMLQQAREHYETAIALIQKAEDSVSENSSRPSSFSSSQLHSPAGSVSWTSSSAVSSPTASVCSFDDILLEAGETEPTTAKAAAAPQPRTAVTTRPRKKTVTFSEPLIRPDSPTLGFDESLSQNKDLPPLPRDDADLGDAAAKDVSLDDSAQRTPKAFRPPPPMFDEMPLPPLPKAVLIAKAAAASVARRSGRDNGSSSNRDSTSTVDSATSAQGSTSTTTSSSSSSSSSSSRPSTLKYLAGLASLREQLRFHLSAVEALISQPTTSANAATATTTATLLPTPVIVPGKLPGGNINRPASVAARRTSSRLSGATSWYSGATAATDGSVDASAISEAADAVRSADEARAQELRARIARLRSEGWRRKRFDASRYEALCDRVMGEIA